MSGGLLLFLIALDLVFVRMSGGTSTTAEEKAEAAGRNDISVFPPATSLIAEPGAIGAAILLVTNEGSDPAGMAAVVAALLSVLAVTFAIMIVAARVQKILGLAGVHVVSRVLGVLLAALTVQFVFDGVRASGLLN